MKKVMLCLFAFLIVSVAMVLTASDINAATSPVDNDDLLFYARIGQGTILHTDEWAVIIFYRPPECVPNDFNLLDFTDDNAPACTPLTMDGFIVTSGGSVPSTILIKLNGLGDVPVWFVAWSELNTAVTDGMLTMPELEGLPSLLKGTANFYTETQNPEGTGKKPPTITCVAQGSLEDGRSFNANAILVGDKVIKVSIAFE